MQEFLRPEIFNRIDHIVPFVPLDPVTVELITRREIKLIEDRNGLRLRGVTLEVSQEAIADLARRGYDTRYGARTLKRLIEREILIATRDSVKPKDPYQTDQATEGQRIHRWWPVVRQRCRASRGGSSLE